MCLRTRETILNFGKELLCTSPYTDNGHGKCNHVALVMAGCSSLETGMDIGEVKIRRPV